MFLFNAVCDAAPIFETVKRHRRASVKAIHRFLAVAVLNDTLRRIDGTDKGVQQDLPVCLRRNAHDPIDHARRGQKSESQQHRGRMRLRGAASDWFPLPFRRGYNGGRALIWFPLSVCKTAATDILFMRNLQSIRTNRADISC